MSTAPYNQNAYGLTQALINVFPAPIVSQRAPTTADKADYGTLWIYQPTNAAYVLTSIVNNSANWGGLTGGSGSFTNLTVSGTSNLTGLLTATGGITSPANIVTTSTGQINSATTMTAGTGLTITTGNGLASAGMFVATGVGSGSGLIASQTGIAGGSVTYVNGTGTGFVVAPTTGSATTASSGFLKFYTHNGTSVVTAYVPYWQATS